MPEDIFRYGSRNITQKVASCGYPIKVLRLISFGAVMIFLFIPVIGNAQHKYYSSTPLFPMEECVEDLVFYLNKLQREHPNLYLYTSKQEFNQYFDSIVNSIETPLNSLNFYNLITLVASRIRDGNTRIFPAGYNEKEPNQSDPLIPLQVHWEVNRMFVTQDYSPANAIPAGSEILRINGVSIPLLYDVMMRRLPRDGFNETYPRWIMDNWFSQYYAYHIERPEYFNLEVQYPNGSLNYLNIRALPQDSIDFYRQANYKEPLGNNLNQSGIRFTMDTLQNVALLKIKDFRDDMSNLKYTQAFDSIIHDYITQIIEHNLDHLILDLRDNTGIDAQNGVQLLSYLLDQPFQFFISHYKVDKMVNNIPEARLTPTKGPWVEMIEPHKLHFAGKVYVLINGGSFSTTAVVCSALRSQNRCIFVGEETGGNPHLASGGGEFTTLPNTKLKVVVPTLQYVIRNRDKNIGHGIMPDYPIYPSLHDVIAGRDPVLEFAYSLIKKGKG